MNGQQKNYLVSLATVFQTSEKFDVNAEERIPVGSWKKIDVVSDIRIERGMKVKIWKGQNLLASFSPMLYESHRVLESIVLMKSGVTVHPFIPGKEEIFVKGSRMNSGSGVWHNRFVQFLSDYGVTGTVVFSDYNEEPGRALIGGIQAIWMYPPKISPQYTIMIDDSQLGDRVIHEEVFSEKYSRKKMGKKYFNFENREFSHVSDILPYNMFTECQCERCCAVAFVSYRLEGYATFLRIQSDLAFFGPVCVKERVERSRSLLYEMKHLPYGRRNEKKYLKLLSEVKGEEMVSANKWLASIVAGKSVYLAGYYKEFDQIHINRRSIIDLAVVSSVHALSEIGFPPAIMSKGKLPLPGYREKVVQDWYVYDREERKFVGRSVKLKL